MEITWKCAGPPKSPQTIFYMISCYFIIFYRWSEYAEEKSIQRAVKVDEEGHNCHLTFFFYTSVHTTDNTHTSQLFL
jgi:hypothetical protein